MSAKFDIADALLDCSRALSSRGGVDTGSPPASVLRLSSEIIRIVEHEPGNLPNALHASLTDSVRRLDQVSLAVTGLAWLGAGVPSVQQQTASIVQSARSEIALCAYSITGGAGSLIDRIIEVAGQGVTATFVINEFGRQPDEIKERLLNMAKKLPGRIRLFDFNPDNRLAQLHAKVLVADRSTALVGSANLSFHGMVANHELALVVRGPMAEEIAARIDALKKSARSIEP